MARGNQRDKAREKNLKKQASEVSRPPPHPNTHPLARATTRQVAKTGLCHRLAARETTYPTQTSDDRAWRPVLGWGSFLHSTFYATLPVVVCFAQNRKMGLANARGFMRLISCRNQRTARVAPRCSTIGSESLPSCARSKRRVSSQNSTVPRPTFFRVADRMRC